MHTVTVTATTDAAGPRHAKGKAPPGEIPPAFARDGAGIGQAAAQELAALLLPVLNERLSAILPVLSQVVRDGVAAALAGQPVRTAGESCATCLLARAQWDAAHAAEIREAIAARWPLSALRARPTRAWRRQTWPGSCRSGCAQAARTRRPRCGTAW
jgi:hypothetical protein